MHLETTPMAVRRTFPVPPLWVAGALIIFLAWWRFPRSVLPISGMWVLGILHGLGGGVLSVLPLPIWPFAPSQTVSHYVVHGVYVIAQIPLLLLAFTLMRRVRSAPLTRPADK